MPETTVSPKVGDIVRIVIEGPVHFAYDDGDLQIGTPGNAAFLPAEFAKFAEILAPPVEVGDAATLSVLDELPHGSVVIATAGGLVAQLTVSHTGARLWRIPGKEQFTRPTLIAHWPATVLHVGTVAAL